jgi:hypothetical protein
MLAATGRLPGMSPLGFTDADVLQTATRELQVDGVIEALLGGEASPETRQVLINGENPLVREQPAGADPDPAMGGRGGRGGRGGGAGGRGAAATGRAGQPPQGVPAGQGFGPLPQLRGLPLVVGLALGSPEFQRR